MWTTAHRRRRRRALASRLRSGLPGLGVQAVMSGYVGPKAFTALKAAGLDVYQDMDNRSVGEAVRCLADGSVSPATAPNK